MITVSTLASRLQRAEIIDSKLRASCPTATHKNGDRSRGLEAELSSDGKKLLLCCHAGCTTESICDALGINIRDLFAGSSGHGVEPRSIDAVYKYVDEAAVHLYDVIRYKPKDFRQRKPDGSWNVKGVRRVLYRLPEVLLALYIFIVEGEKDVDALTAIGLTATCNPGGAGKWRDEYSEPLAGKHSVILPDNDPPGDEHAQQVARSIAPKAASVKVLKLPNLPARGDVSDYIARRRADGLDNDAIGEELSRLAEAARAWAPAVPEQPAAMPFISMSELLSAPEEEIEWAVDGMLPAAGDSLLVAKPKVGKSTLARCLALAQSRGDKFLGRNTKQGIVFYLALEEKLSEVKKHFLALGATESDPIFIFCATSPADGLMLLREAMKQHRPVLVIIDPLFRFVRVKDGNDYVAVTNALEPLHSLARESGAHVLSAHHAGKAGDRESGDSVLGSTAIFAAVDTLIVMKRHEKYRTVSSVQRYGTDLEEIVLDYDPETRSLTAGVARADADITTTIRDIEQFLKTQAEPVEERVIHDAVEGRRSLKQRAIRESIKLGTTIRTGTGKKGERYLYSVSGTQVQPYIAGTTVPETLSVRIDSGIAGTRLFEQGKVPVNPGYQHPDDSDYRETLREFQRRHEGRKL